MNAKHKCLADVPSDDKAPAALAEAALTYVRERGWPIFPISPMGKTPLISQDDGGNGVLDATTDERQIREWWSKYPKANIGLDVGGAGMMALDLDPGHDLAELQRAIGRLPDTRLRQRTPRGGKHLFYALNEGEIVAASASKLAPCVDVRSFHSYVLLAPSKTKDGGYCWEVEDWPAPRPAHRTDEMVRLSNSATRKSGNRDTWIIEPDMAAHVERARDWLLKTAQVAVSGQGGDHNADSGASRPPIPE